MHSCIKTNSVSNLSASRFGCERSVRMFKYFLSPNINLAYGWRFEGWGCTIIIIIKIFTTCRAPKVWF